MPPVIVENQDVLPLDETQSREKIAFGLKRKAGPTDEDMTSKKSKDV